MPDPKIISRDAYHRAKADAEAKYGRWRPFLPTLSMCMVSGMVMATAAGALGVGADTSRSLAVITILIGVATLIAYLWEWRVIRKKSRLIDQRWRTLTAESARLRETCNTSWQSLVALRHE